LGPPAKRPRTIGTACDVPSSQANSRKVGKSGNEAGSEGNMQTENRTAHVLATFLAPVLVFSLFTAAVADKVKIEGKPILKGGPIKSTNGDEAGTLKEVAKMRMMPPPGGTPPPPITVHFDLLFGSSEGQATASAPIKGAAAVGVAKATSAAPRPGFRLSGKGTNWQLRRLQDGFGLWVDGRRVDAVHSALFRREKSVEIMIYTEPLDPKMAAAGAIRLEVQDAHGKTVPTFPDVCGPVKAPPIPYPIIKK
jgi:hypothetical protein